MSSDNIKVEENKSGVKKEEINFAVLSHLLIFSGLIIPLANFVAPLLIYFFKKGESQFIRKHAAESINLQISIVIYIFLSVFILMISAIVVPGLKTPFTPLLMGFGMFIYFAFLGIMILSSIVLIVIASVKASKGQEYKYPFMIRILS